MESIKSHLSISFHRGWLLGMLIVPWIVISPRPVDARPRHCTDVSVNAVWGVYSPRSRKSINLYPFLMRGGTIEYEGTDGPSFDRESIESQEAAGDEDESDADDQHLSHEDYKGDDNDGSNECIIGDDEDNEDSLASSSGELESDERECMRATTISEETSSTNSTAVIDDEEENEDDMTTDESPSSLDIQSLMEVHEQNESDPMLSSSIAENSETVVPTHTDDSSAFVDSQELADAYDEESPPPIYTDTDSSSVSLPNQKIDSDIGSRDASEPPIVLPTIDNAMKKVLCSELKYTRREVNRMRPEIALMVVEKRLRRPNEGMPPSFYISQKSLERSNILSKVPRIVLGGVVIATLAVVGGPTFVPLLHSIPALISSSERENTASLYFPEEEDIWSDLLTNTTESSASDPIPVNEHVNKVGEVHPHSVKPGQHPSDEIDVTWLDKLITAVENKIKSILRMEL